MKRCSNYENFNSTQFGDLGEYPTCEGFRVRNTDYCKQWKSIDSGNETLTILRATLECYERQYEYSCNLGDARCVKCDYNIRQGTISEHMEALKEAIKAIEEGEKK